MGMIYNQKGSKNLWIKYYRDGRPIRESSGSDKHEDAKNLLKQREGAVANGVPVTARVGQVRFEELAADVVTDYKVNGKRSLDAVERRIRKHLKPFFGGRRMAKITTAHVRGYIVTRQEAGAANGEINRELSVLNRAFNLGVESGKLLAKPKIRMLAENNVRTGFFEPEQFEALRARLPAPLCAVVTFLYLTGWRISEVLTLQWRQVEFAAGWVRLDVGTTKNGDGRVFPFTAELRTLLEAQRAYTDAVQHERGIICPSVFHRGGKPIKSLRRAWDTACKAAGCPGMIRHDFRRTAVRNLVRAAIPERVAMTMTGHKTRSVFERYNIVSEGDLITAAQRLDAAAGIVSGIVHPKGVSSGSAPSAVNIAGSTR